MKNLSLGIIFLFIHSYSILNAQGVGIGTNSPDPSAALDIVDTDKGVLLPRLTSTQRTTMANPVQSLLVFDIDTNSFWWRDGSKWVELASSSNGLNDSDRDTGVYVEQTEDEDEVTISLAGQERARFFNDQLYLKDKLSLGTYSKRGMITMRGPDDPEFGPSMFMYGNSADQSESGRLRFVEGTTSTNWRGSYIHYDGGANLMHLGTHNLSNNDPATDFNAMTIKRINGFVGINQSNPQQRLSVNGDVKINDGGITIETNQQEIILQAGTATVTISDNGNIFITSPSGNINMDAQNININASQNLSISAANITQVATTDFELTSGNDLVETTGGDLITTAGGNLETTAIGNIEVLSNGSILHDANTQMSFVSNAAMSLQSGTSMSLSASGNTDIVGSLILLNANTGSNGASRIGDHVSVPDNSTNGTITSGSTTVRIGN